MLDFCLDTPGEADNNTRNRVVSRRELATALVDVATHVTAISDPENAAIEEQREKLQSLQTYAGAFCDMGGYITSGRPGYYDKAEKITQHGRF